MSEINIRELLEKAHEAFFQKKYEETIKILDSIPNDIDITESQKSEKLAYLGLSNGWLNNKEIAKKYLSQIEPKPNIRNYAGAQFWLGDLSIDLDEKTNYYKKIKEEWDSEIYSWSQEGLLEECVFPYCKLEKFDKAKEILPFIKLDSLQYQASLIKRIIDSKEDSNTNFLKIYEKINSIIRKLHINNKDNTHCTQFAHYTSCHVALLMLRDGGSSSKLRMGITDMMNDPMEGKVLNNWLQIDESFLSNRYKSRNYLSFASCFSFNHDSLNQFRLYGKKNNTETTGVSLVFNFNYFSEKNDGISINTLSNTSENSDKNK